MQKLFLTVTAILLSLLTTSLNAQYKVERIRPLQAEEKPLNKGLYYMLPANGFKISITVQTTVYKKGIYSRYAAALLGITDFVRENKSVSEIENIKIRNTVIADNNQIFYVRSIGKNGILPSLSYSRQGVLLGVNMPSVSTSASTPTPKLANISRDYSKQSKETHNNKTIFPFAEMNVVDDFDTIIKEELRDDQVIEQTIVTSRTVEKTEEQRAKELAALIVESKKQRSALISGYSEVNYAPETMRFMYEQMLVTENEYLRCFTGTSHKSNHTYEITIDIEDTVSCYLVGTFTSKEEPLYLTLKKLTPESIKQVERFEKKSVDQTENTGFFVRYPQMVTATVESEKKVFAEEILHVSQWGTVYSLPVGDFTIELNSYSGAVKMLKKR
ncbi:MAG: DUF4831 family protein [Bacteroidales bacterium]|jgi:hypothetical protein|nr:DUF4831 family protein [Bacteroidales bacterium]